MGKMSWEQLEPTYQAVWATMKTFEAVTDLPGYAELYNLMAKHTERIAPHLTSLFMRDQLATNHNTLYIGLILGLLYCYEYGLPDWAMFWQMAKKKDGG